MFSFTKSFAIHKNVNTAPKPF